MLQNIVLTSLLLSSATAAPAKSSKTDNFRWLGRVNPATRELTWPGTGVAFSFTGTSASVAISKVDGDNSFDLIVDNTTTTIFPPLPTSINLPKLAKGSHDVTLLRRSETALGTVVLGAVTADGPLKPLAPPAGGRQIEVIGDSITVGYGLDGKLPCTNNAVEEDNPKTYGALTANTLKADYHIVAWSGKGLIRNYVTAPSNPDTSPIMPELWTRYGANDASGNYPFPANWKPQAVVINLGTNDFGYLQQYSNGTSYAARPQITVPQFSAALVKFIQQVEAKYPAAKFFLMTSPMLNDNYPSTADAQKTTQTQAIQSAIKTVGEEKAFLVDWPSQGSDVGCDYHPTAATHAQGAKILEGVVAKALGW